MKKKALYKKWMSMLLAGVVTTTGFMGGTVTLRAAETTNWIGDEGLNGSAEAPAADDVVPDKNQFRYQKEELAAFCHFGPNTFNEIEWGEHYGDKKPSEIFTLKQDFDAETLVKTLKDAGFKKLIVTAKHHDGFCIWDSEHTEYDVAASGYKDANGQSDILAEISKACTDQNMDMGLYLSPWDIHDESYGYYDENHKPTDKEHDHLDYNEYYDNQLKEILGNEKYGNKGHFVEVWMDGAKGNGANAQEYDFKRWFNTIQENEGIKAGYDADCMLFGAEAYTTVRWIGNELGIAGKDTWSKSTVDKEKNTINSNKQGNATVGFEDGNQWTVPEADARITSGWFWGTKKNTPKTMDELSDMYFNSVGHNATLLLNIPPNNQGTVDKAILDRVTEFGNNIKETFKTNLAKAEGASVKVSEVRGNDETFKPGNMIDDNDETYWTTSDGNKSGEILVDLGEKKNFDVVSIEEAIQNGQRINKYKVEYREGDSGEWTLLEEGQTIGAKRLCRTSEVSAKQIKITVETKDGKVPMISEVGVYKSTEDMEKPNPIPKGMEVIDVTDKNVEDGKGFTFKGTWHDENQPQYINGTNTWANAGAELELKFHGTKAYFFGTVDPNHGKAEITIDGGDPITVDTKASKRAVGQRWFETPDLQDGDHTIKLKVSSQAIGIEAAAVINNGGKGMIELESDSYTMNEDETKDLKVKRVGGTEGKITAKLQPNPGTAIQDDYNTELNPVITLEPGQKETTAQVQTKRNKNKTGDQYFTAEITDVSEGAILGFNKKAKINIKDMESSEGSLAALVKECESYKKDWFTSGWDEFESALKQAKIVLEDKNATPEKRNEAEVALKKAKEGLVKREKYTAEDPFAFPWRKNSSAILEAEFAELHNTGENEKWPLKVSDADWASNGYFVNAMNSGDQITLHYHAEKPGKYKATVQFRSGDTNNGLTWSEADNKIAAQTEVVKIGAGDQAKATHTQDIEFVVNEAGDGTLVFTAPEKNAPQLDKFDITMVEEKAPVVVNKDALKAVIEEGNKLLEEADKYTEESVKALGDAIKEAEEVVKNEKATQAEVDQAAEAIETAISGLTVKPAPEADKTALKAALAEAAQKLENAESFTEESVNALKEAMDLAQSVLDNPEANQAEADAATTAVRTAIENLQEKPPVQKEFTITAVAHGGGTIDPSGAVKVEEGKDQVFTIQPYEGFEVKEVFVNGESVGAVTEYKFEAVRADASIEVFFAEKEAVQADKTKLNESIAAAEELLKHAEDYVPEDVQNLMEVLDAAKAVAADPAVTQETVDAAQNALDAAMNIAPIQKEFAIMAAAGEGGSITPCGTVKVERGMSQTFAIQPKEGYVISDVLVNGQSVGAVAEYTFCDVNADANITALFQKAAVSTDKSQLTAVIKEAEERLEQADKYTEETVKALQKEVEAAQFILADKEASQADIDAAVQKVRTAIDALEEKAQTEKPENPDNNKPDNKPDNKPGNGNNGGQNNNGNNNQSSTQKPSAGTPNKAVKTGDATPIAGAVSGLLAGGAALLAFLKRRR